MIYRSRSEALKGLLFPRELGGKSKGYEMTTDSSCIKDWSPHNLRRLVIAPQGFAVGYYRLPSNRYTLNGKKFSLCALSTGVECQQALYLDLESLAQGKELKSILDVLVRYKQFSMIEEIVFCNYGNESRQLFQIDSNLSVLAKQSKTQGKIEDKLKSKYPRLSRIYYVNAEFKKISSFMLESTSIKSLGSTLYDSLVSHGASCTVLFDRGSEDWKRGRYTSFQDYQIDELLDADIGNFIAKMDEDERLKKEKEIHEKAEKSRSGASGRLLVEFMSENRDTFSSCLSIIDRYSVLRAESPPIVMAMWGYTLFSLSGIMKAVDSGNSGLTNIVPESIYTDQGLQENDRQMLKVLIEGYRIDKSKEIQDALSDLLLRLSRYFSVVLGYAVLVLFTRTSRDSKHIVDESKKLGLSSIVLSRSDIRIISDLSGISVTELLGIFDIAGIKIRGITDSVALSKVRVSSCLDVLTCLENVSMRA